MPLSIADRAIWAASLYQAEAPTGSGPALEEALAWRLVGLVAPELKFGPFLKKCPVRPREPRLY